MLAETLIELVDLWPTFGRYLQESSRASLLSDIGLELNKAELTVSFESSLDKVTEARVQVGKDAKVNQALNARMQLLD